MNYHHATKLPTSPPHVAYGLPRDGPDSAGSAGLTLSWSGNGDEKATFFMGDAP